MVLKTNSFFEALCIFDAIGIICCLIAYSDAILSASLSISCAVVPMTAKRVRNMVIIHLILSFFYSRCEFEGECSCDVGVIEVAWGEGCGFGD